MIKYFCDICNKEITNGLIYNVSISESNVYASKEYKEVCQGCRNNITYKIDLLRSKKGGATR